MHDMLDDFVLCFTVLVVLFFFFFDKIIPNVREKRQTSVQSEAQRQQRIIENNHEVTIFNGNLYIDGERVVIPFDVEKINVSYRKGDCYCVVNASIYDINQKKFV